MSTDAIGMRMLARLKTGLLAALGVCGCLGVAGCAGLFVPNAWEFHKGNLESSCLNDPWSAGFRRYTNIRIGTDEKPFFKSAPQFAIKLSDGRVMLSSDFTLENVRRISAVPWPASVKLPKGSTVLDSPPYLFRFLDDKLVSFEAGVTEDESGKLLPPVPVIGSYDQKRFFKMPLTQGQLIELFGKPDKIEKDWRI